MKIIGLLLRLLRWSEVGLVWSAAELISSVLCSVFVYVAVAIFGSCRMPPSYLLPLFAVVLNIALPTSAFASVPWSRAPSLLPLQYCIQSSQLSTGICGASLATPATAPRMNARHRSFRFRGPQAMPCPGPGHGYGYGYGHGHEPGPCVRLESFVLFDL